MPIYKKENGIFKRSGRIVIDSFGWWPGGNRLS
jgi:hypothetical protein